MLSQFVLKHKGYMWQLVTIVITIFKWNESLYQLSIMNMNDSLSYGVAKSIMKPVKILIFVLYSSMSNPTRMSTHPRINFTGYWFNKRQCRSAAVIYAAFDALWVKWLTVNVGAFFPLGFQISAQFENQMFTCDLWVRRLSDVTVFLNIDYLSS